MTSLCMATMVDSRMVRPLMKRTRILTSSKIDDSNRLVKMELAFPIFHTNVSKFIDDIGLTNHLSKPIFDRCVSWPPFLRTTVTKTEKKWNEVKFLTLHWNCGLEFWFEMSKYIIIRFFFVTKQLQTAYLRFLLWLIFFIQ